MMRSTLLLLKPGRSGGAACEELCLCRLPLLPAFFTEGCRSTRAGPSAEAGPPPRPSWLPPHCTASIELFSVTRENAYNCQRLHFHRATS